MDQFSSESHTYVPVPVFAREHGVPERTVRNWCRQGKIMGVLHLGRNWLIPEEAQVPERGKFPLINVLLEQKEMQLRGNIYHRLMIDMTYNSNHMEGSRLTHDQTRMIFETNTIGLTKDKTVNIDDVIETANHFRCIDYVIDNATRQLTQSMIRELHAMLKQGTSMSRQQWFRIGDYKLLPNEVGGIDTTPPEQVPEAMARLLAQYHCKRRHTLHDILDFHVRFERIHPFQDGNGRVGRLIMLKECLRNGIVPFIIDEEHRPYYYRGLQQWPQVEGYLTDTCLSAQDHFRALLAHFGIKC